MHAHQMSGSRWRDGTTVPIAAAIVIGLIATAGLVGWLADIPILRTPVSFAPATNPLTVVTFFLLASALLLSAARRVVAARWFAVLVMAVAVTKLLSLVAIEFPLDRWLVPSQLATEPLALANRMAPNTAGCFLLISMSLIATTGSFTGALWIRKSCVFIVLVTAYVALLGYIYRAKPFFEIPEYVPMRLQTAISLIFASIGVLALRPQAGTWGLLSGDTVGSQLIRMMMPAVLFGPPIIGGLLLWLQLDWATGPGLATAVFVAATTLLFSLVVGWMAVQLDRADRRRREADGLARRMQSIIANNFDAIISTTVEAKVVTWNPAAERLFGYRADEIIGQSILRIVPEDRVTEIQERLAAVRRGERVEPFETNRLRRDGTGVPILITLSAVRDEDNRVVGHSGILHDITHVKQVERELKQAMSEAERANRAKSEFLANVSHEIRTPMTAILGFADLLLEPDQTPEARIASINVVRRNAKHLLTIINDILDLSKIEAGEMSVERAPCSPCHVLYDVISLMRVRATEKRIGFSVRIATPLPERVESDAIRVRQILINLVSNAIKFTNEGSVELVAAIEPVGDGQSKQLRFDVVDTGIGISAAQRVHLFKPFMQVDASSTRRHGGTGLGLAISMRLAQLLGGRIDVVSREGQGSTFSLFVPVGSLEGVRMLRDCSEAILDLDAASEPLKDVTLHGRILLVDDGADNRMLLSVYLRAAGAEVVEAENGRIACELVAAAMRAEFPFDLVLLDMQMPELDGYGAATRMRGEGYDGPIVALTAHAMPQDREKCLRSGCDDYLSKPMTRTELLATVALHLHRGDPEMAKRLSPVRDETLAPYVASFVATLQTQADELCRLVEQGCVERIREIVHQLKGSGGLFGFPRITEIARQVEDALEGECSTASMTAEVERLVAELRGTTT